MLRLELNTKERICIVNVFTRLIRDEFEKKRDYERIGLLYSIKEEISDAINEERG